MQTLRMRLEEQASKIDALEKKCDRINEERKQDSKQSAENLQNLLQKQQQRVSSQVEELNKWHTLALSQREQLKELSQENVHSRSGT